MNSSNEESLMRANYQGEPSAERFSGLRFHMTFSYIWVTVVTVFLFLGLYTILLTGSISFTLSQEQVVGTKTHFPSLATYPLQGLLVLILLTVGVAPIIGGLFGTFTTKSIIQRVYTLVGATTQIAHGDYRQRLTVTKHDELGQLEQQVNRMAEQLAENREQRHHLVEQNARLAERSRISRELHDAISQDLFSLHMLTDGLHMALPVDSELQPHIAALEQTTINMLREMRALLLELRPIQLEQQGLVAALEELAATYRDRLDINVTTTFDAVPLSVQMEHTLLRIVQEALVNAVRHADATDIAVRLVSQKERVVLSITDNGKGFAVNEGESQHGFGLRLMQERVRELHGSFTLDTAPRRGTSIVIGLPAELGANR